jgi:hypothetical protein
MFQRYRRSSILRPSLRPPKEKAVNPEDSLLSCPFCETPNFVNGLGFLVPFYSSEFHTELYWPMFPVLFEHVYCRTCGGTLYEGPFRSKP